MAERAHKVHLLVRERAACGQPHTRATVVARFVTCLGCQKTLHMADAEVRQQLEPKRFSH